MPRAKRISIRDVAREAGVSTTTVSDALSGRGRLPQVTRDRVTQVATELGYTANPSARWLRSGRTGAVGLYFPARTVGLEYYMRLALGAADEAFAHGLALTLVPTPRSADPLPALHLDGVVLADPAEGDPMVARLSDLGVPVVTCERDVTPGAQHQGTVQGDHLKGTHELLDHLADQGARRVGLLCPGDETSFGRDVRSAYREWCAARGAPVLLYDVPLAVQAADVTGAVRLALAERPGPDALVAVPDGSIVPALQAIHTAGLEIPRDLLLAGYVDSSTMSSLPVPITALDLSPTQMGRQAARLLAGLVEGECQPGAVVDVPVRLVARASTTPSLGATGPVASHP